MRFGVCCGLQETSTVLEAGFDYVEMAAVSFSGDSSDWDPTPFEGLPLEATNVFFPGSIRLADGNLDPYMARTIERAASLGVQLMVIGSGASRRSMVEEPAEDAEERFVRVAARAQEIARLHGIKIAPESLNRSETDVGNDLGDLSRRLSKRSVGFTADSYHLLVEWDAEHPGLLPDEAFFVEQIPFRPLHVHLGDLSRNVPRANDPAMRGFVHRLRQLDYDGRVSLECRRDIPLDEALTQVRSLFDQ